ncbi:Zn-dependent hydrolase [Mesorhizobium sp. L-8-10]|uniref:Zn-dependent hydrolase n=1 Tax=Mesorhizobium sp. L-8-10 TaxID=2744523 RepID=UPI001937133A|nr:Zn-dependent hydrolase [Mesorhizobium sp. L-8-10]BCH33288.1 Zn-dependent hydrolase [Mesorhizobium sp. L-8-10]
MAQFPAIDIDGTYVERLILELGAIGAHSGTGVWRTVYSPEWVKANALVSRWFEDAGLTVRQDAVGNLWGRLEGSEVGKSIVSGSHIDTQRPGGRYDGALGILAALVAIRALRERFGQPKRTLEAVSLCEEEGSRFPTAGFWGSRAITGRIGPGDTETVKDFDGIGIAEAMRAVGLDPLRVAEAKRDDIEAFVELHIEQGPVLEHAGLSVAVVDAITGIRHTEVRLTGVQNHAGAFPMDLRNDPMAGFAEIATGLIDTAHRMGRPAVTTIGRCTPYPNSGAVIPQSVTFTIDARHPDPESRGRIYAMHDALMREVAARRGLGLETKVLADHEACPSAPDLVTALRAAAESQGVGTLTMASGAGHDSQQMAAIAKVAMIFVRSKDGRSHTPEEFSSIEDIVDGIRVLAAGLYKLAY